MLKLPAVHLFLAVLALSSGVASASDERRNFVFTAKEFNLPLDASVTFTAETQRTFRVEYSDSPAHPDLLMLYSYLYFCAARKVALEQGFDRYGLLQPQGQTQSGTAFFLSPGESASQVLGPEFSKAPVLPIDYPTIAAMCDSGAGKGKQ